MYVNPPNDSQPGQACSPLSIRIAMSVPLAKIFTPVGATRTSRSPLECDDTLDPIDRYTDVCVSNFVEIWMALGGNETAKMSVAGVLDMKRSPGGKEYREVTDVRGIRRMMMGVNEDEDERMRY